MNRRLLLKLLATLSLDPAGICSPTRPNFSGRWKQSNERCVPRRATDVTRQIVQRGSDLIVETTVVRGSAQSRHAVQHYVTDGTRSVSTGADGDEFRTSVVWRGESLEFSVEEHEDGRVIVSKEMWTLVENGTVLQVQREVPGATESGARKQTLIYQRESTALGIGSVQNGWSQRDEVIA